MPRSALGAQLARACAARGLTRREAAEQLGISLAHLAHLHSGRRQPSMALLARLASWLVVPVGELLGPAREPAGGYLARHTAPLVVRHRALAASVAHWRRWAEHRSLQADTEAERARCEGEAAAYARVAAALHQMRDAGAAVTSPDLEPEAWVVCE